MLPNVIERDFMSWFSQRADSKINLITTLVLKVGSHEEASQRYGNQAQHNPRK